MPGDERAEGNQPEYGDRLPSSITRRITAGQYLYGKLRAEDSEHGREGFQVIACTPGCLAESQIAGISAHLLGPLPLEGEPHRLFAVLGKGDARKVLVGQVSYARYRDSAGREDQLVAHLLIIGAEEFARKLAGNPFYILDGGFTFASTIEDAIALREQAKERIDLAVELTRDLGRDDVEKWDAADATARTALARLAACEHWPHAVDDGGEPKPDAIRAEFVGTPGEVEETLRGIFALLSAETRMACTFNTGPARTTLAEFGLWACGRRDRGPTQEHVARVDCAARTVEGVSLHAFIPENYGLWLVDFTEAGASYGEVLRDRPDAVKAFRLIDGRGDDHYTASAWRIAEPVLASLRNEHQLRVRERLAELVSEGTRQLNHPLDHGKISEELRKYEPERLLKLRDGYEPIPDWLLRRRLSEKRPVTPDEDGQWDAVLQLVSHHGGGDMPIARAAWELWRERLHGRGGTERLHWALSAYVSKHGQYPEIVDTVCRRGLIDPRDAYQCGFGKHLAKRCQYILREPSRLAALLVAMQESRATLEDWNGLTDHLRSGPYWRAAVSKLPGNVVKALHDNTHIRNEPLCHEITERMASEKRRNQTIVLCVVSVSLAVFLLVMWHIGAFDAVAEWFRSQAAAIEQLTATPRASRR